MKKIIVAVLLLLSLSLFLVSCDIGAELESFSDQLMSQLSDAAGSFLKEADTSSDDKPETEDTGAETGETITEE